MRIARLDLARYGRFTDRTIDFGEKPKGAPDFHVVFGLNEAGKSTTASAILDLYFGIGDRTAYGAGKGRSGAPNWHPYSAMRIGARLELSGGAREVARLKRDRNSLVDPDSRPLDEALIKAELGGVDRDAFGAMFSLDDDSLEKGGEAILASRGDLGQLLFSASAGLAELGGRLGTLRDEADRFFKPRAHKTELAEKKRQLEALKAERDEADTLASAYAELGRLRDEAQAAYEASSKALGERRARAEAIRRLLQALPHLAALREAESALAPLADLPPTREGWQAEIARLEAEAIKLETERESAERAVASLESGLAEIHEDATALGVAARVEGWREARGRYVTAKDIPLRQGERDAKRATAAEILRRLGRERESDPRRLLLPVQKAGELEDLIAARSGVVSKLDAARAAHGDAKAALEAATAEAPEDQPDGAAIEALKRELMKARRDDSAARLRALRIEREKLGRKIVEGLAGLAPWRDDPTLLAAVEVPGEAETEVLRQRLARAKTVRDEHRRRLAEQTGEAERLRAEDAAARRAEIVSDEAATNIRSTREATWAAHRAALDSVSAEAFEAAMRRDDAASATRLAHAHEVAAQRERAVKLAGLDAGRATARAELNAAEAELQALNAEIAALMPVAAPAGREPLAFLDAWRARRAEALTLIGRLDDMKDEARRVDAVAERTRKALCAALRAASVAFDPERGVEALIDAAEYAIAMEAEVENFRRAVRERRAEAVRAESRLKSAVEEDARWRADWREACAGAWLAEGGAEPPLGAVRQVLSALADLRSALAECDSLDHRIEAMHRDRRAFADEVADIARALGVEDIGDPLAIADAVEQRVARAHEDERRRAEKRTALGHARAALAEVAGKRALNAKLAAAMTERLGASTLGEAAQKLDACRRRDVLIEEVAKETRAILALGVADGLEATRAALDGADRTALVAELADFEAQQADEDAAHAERFARFSDAKRRLDAVGGDDAVARIEEKRRTILEEIKEGARRYLTLRAGVAAAEAALSLYRERHRGAMMERASRAFCEISRGAYRGLAAEPNGDSETLIALSADGGSKTAEQLSKGARFQLYLALRVAGYHELAKTRPPAPFVADDIMETFDHFRAEEALRLFADMGRAGQVIYLTHHLHLVEIAKRVCPEARVHELAG